MNKGDVLAGVAILTILVAVVIVLDLLGTVFA